MKKLNVLFVILIVMAFVASCSKEQTGNDESLLKKATIVYGPSTPLSVAGITPYIIPGENNGGNRTCAEVATYFNTSFDLCGDKLDYSDFDLDGDYEFSGSFPEGLDVTVEGIYISFDIDGCLMINGEYYKVGAVIVKGSNAANIYYYPGGSTGDSGLAAPGEQPMLSNLTFCFVSCEMPAQKVIAVKTFLWGPDGYTWAGSDGSYIFQPTTEWCQYLGIVNYPETTSFALLEDFTRANLGNVTVTEAYPGGVRSLVITVTSSYGLLDKTYVYVGDLEGIYGTGACPNYGAWPNQDLNDSQTHTFTVPF
jgi:hypothetical protein